MLRCKSTHFISYKHQNHQKIIQYADNFTITHTIPRYFGCKTKYFCHTCQILPLYDQIQL